MQNLNTVIKTKLFDLIPITISRVSDDDLLKGATFKPETIEEIVLKHCKYDGAKTQIAVAYIKHVGLTENIELLIADALADFQGVYKSWAEFAKNNALYSDDIPDTLMDYIDWDLYGNSLKNQYFCSGNYFFLKP